MSGTANNQGQGHSKGPVKLKAETVVTARGKIEATFKKEVEYPEDYGQTFFLPEGEVLEVAQDTAYYIKGETSWYYAEFFESGRMTGPVVYAEAKIGSAQSSFLKNLDGNFCLVSGLAMIIFGITFGPLLLVNLYPAPGLSFSPLLFISGVSITLLCLFIGVIGALMTWESLRCRTSRDHAIKALKAKEKKATPYITAALTFDPA